MTTRILLVDDERALLQLLKRSLERAGYSVVACDSAEAAMEVLQSPPAGGWAPDILIVDEGLPGESGTKLAVRLLARYPAMRCLLCSGFPLSLDLLAAADRWRAAVLQKPYMPPALETAVAALIAVSPPKS
ncbi:MAG: response regulator [Acidobacteria bacterium]|nr:response regulator [Acidobacteriota bacterium]